MFIIEYNTTQNMIKRLQQVKGKTKIKFRQIVNGFYDEMNIRRQNGTFQFEEDTFAKNAEVNSETYHEVFLLMKFLQTKLQIKSLKIKYYDSIYTLLKLEMTKNL